MALKLEQSERYEGNDWWSWQVWLEGDSKELANVEFVEYTLHQSFPKPVRRRHDRATKFMLETSGWGVFTIYAKAVKTDGSAVNLSHELKLTYPDGSENAE